MTSRFQKRSPAKGRKSAPLARSLDLTIDEVGARGDGVARHQDDVIYVPFTVAGDRVLARVDGRRGDGLTASVVDVIAPGPHRVSASCPHYGPCGGCTVQHMADQAYEDWKRDLLLTPLTRLGIDADLVQPLVRVSVGERRRASFAFSRRKGGVVLGFHGRASHSIIDVQSCLLLTPSIIAILPALRDMLIQVVAGGEDGDVVVIAGENGLDILVEADARLDLFDRERLAAFAEQHDLARLSWRRPGGGGIDPIARRRPALVRFGERTVEPPPGGFLQPTVQGERAIAQAVLDGLQGTKRVADLYSGCGSFTIPLASGGRMVHAVEGDDAPIQSLQAAANAAGLSISTEVRDLARRPLLAHELKAYDAVVFDPPRAGAAPQAEQLAAAGPSVVVAVSCNPATLGRDLKILLDGGYAISRIVPIDQFPYSAHLEAVAVLRRS